MPQFIPGWVASGYTNDLTYDNAGTCPPAFPTVIPQVSVRVHTLWQDACTGQTPCEPSACGNWNTTWGNIAGNHTCVPNAAPGPIQLGLSSSLGSPGPWYTNHSDLWETWKRLQAPDTLDPDSPGALGVLDDLVEDCNVEQITCSFVGDASIPPG